MKEKNLLHHNPVEQVFDENSEDYQKLYMDLMQYQQSFDLFLSHLDQHQCDVLDLACGPGNISKYLLQQRSDLKILGIDLSANMIKLAQVNNPGARFLKMNCLDILQLNQQFNAIICGFCIPYLSKVEMHQLISDSSQLLRSQGLLYISTLEGEYQNSGLKFPKRRKGPALFMYYYSQRDLNDELAKNNFSILHSERKRYKGLDEEEIQEIILIAKLES